MMTVLTSSQRVVKARVCNDVTAWVDFKIAERRKGKPPLADSLRKTAESLIYDAQRLLDEVILIEANTSTEPAEKIIKLRKTRSDKGVKRGSYKEMSKKEAT